MTERMLLLGASGLAREVLAAGIAGVVGILDDDPGRHGTEMSGIPILGGLAIAAERDEKLLVCVGPGAGRRSIVHRLQAAGIEDDRYGVFAARTARIGTTSTVGPGTILLDSVVVTADARIGRHVVVMPNCTVTHDDVLEDFSTLAAGVSLGGAVRICEAAYIGMNASVRQGAEIGRESTVGMGASVITDVPGHEMWVGVPARRLRSVKEGAS